MRDLLSDLLADLRYDGHRVFDRLTWPVQRWLHRCHSCGQRPADLRNTQTGWICFGCSPWTREDFDRWASEEDGEPLFTCTRTALAKRLMKLADRVGP